MSKMEGERQKREIEDSKLQLAQRLRTLGDDGPVTTRIFKKVIRDHFLKTSGERAELSYRDVVDQTKRLTPRTVASRIQRRMTSKPLSANKASRMSDSSIDYAISRRLARGSRFRPKHIPHGYGACGISDLYTYNGERVSANCYAFALSIPSCVHGGLIHRSQKSTPGGRKHCVNRFPMVVTLSPHTEARKELMSRIVADNEKNGVVRAMPVPYTLETAQMDIGDGDCKYHMFACIFGVSDFHFLRRVHLESILRNTHLLQPLEERHLNELERAYKEGSPRYVWCHQRGWQTSLHRPLSPFQISFRKRQGNSSKTFGSPTILDASHNICWSPFPVGADIKTYYMDPSSKRIPQSRRIDMNYGSLNYNQFAGLYVCKTGKARVDESNDDMNIAECKRLSRASSKILD
eukprot:2241507-Pleurochrysis_carterae.AAC.1